MGLGFAVIRPVAALVTGVCGGLLINKYAGNVQYAQDNMQNNGVKSLQDTSNIINKIHKVLHYAFVEMFQSIGLRLLVGLLLAALINVAVPDEFFLNFGSQPLLQMLVILIIAVPMYICSTGSIPIAAALMIKGLSPGAALVMLMAGPAVNLASILVVRKSMGRKFTWIYVSVIVVGAVLFGLLVNAFPYNFLHTMSDVQCQMTDVQCDNCCASNTVYSTFNVICSVVLIIFIINAIVMNLLGKFKKTEVQDGQTVYTVEGMNCSHCKMAVEKAALNVKGTLSAQADVAAKTLTVTGNPEENKLKKAVEDAGFVFKGIKQ